MKERRLVVFNWLIYVTVAILLTAAQTSLFPQVMGVSGVPLLWLTLTVYLALNRKLTESVIFVYFMSILNSSYSSSPIAFFLIVQLIILFGLRTVRARIFWSGGSYFTLSYISAVFVFHFLFFLLSVVFEANPMPSPNWLSWLSQLLWAPLIGFPVYYIYRFIDISTKRASTQMELEAL